MSKSKIKAKIRADYARLLQPFVSGDKSRYYINGIRIEPAPSSGIFMVATDGHRIGIFHDPAGMIEGDGITVKIPHWMLNLAAAEIFLPCDIIIKESGNANLMMGTKMIASNPDVIIDKGNFPNWRERIPAFPDEFGKFSPVFNGRYLADFAGISVNGWIRMVAPSLEGPAFVFNIDVPNFLGVIMPSKNQSLGCAMPDWLV